MICSCRRIGPSNLVGQVEAEVLEEGQKTWGKQSEVMQER